MTNNDHNLNPIGNDRLPWLIIAGSFVLRLILSASIGPGFDEAYYHAFSLHLSGGYFDHPPLVAITAGLGRWLTGVQQPLTLRFGAVLFFTLALIGLYTLTKDLYGHRAGLIALLLPHATPYFLVGAGAFVIPDNALMASWIWALVVAHKIRVNSINKTLGFALLGGLTGLALLAKYHAVLLPASLVIASLVDRRLRSWWLDVRLYLALVIAIAVFSPCLLWNADHNWISFTEQFGKATSQQFRLRFDLLGQALGGQLGYLTPWVCVALWIAVIRRKPESADDLWLKPFFLVPILVFTLLGLKRTILPHWTMPGYIAGFVFAGGYFSQLLGSKNNSFKFWRSKWFNLALGVNLLLVALVLVQFHTGFIPLSEKADPTLDPVGWRETVQELEQNHNLKPDGILFVHKWFSGGELIWATQNRYQVVHIGKKPHMFGWWAPVEDFAGKSGFLITQERYRINDNDLEELLRQRFQIVQRIDVPAVKRGRQKIEMQVFRLVNFIGTRPQEPTFVPN